MVVCSGNALDRTQNTKICRQVMLIYGILLTRISYKPKYGECLLIPEMYPYCIQYAPNVLPVCMQLSCAETAVQVSCSTPILLRN